ncbi:MAG: STAS domain-containing protein [bacterium]|jgi:ABC-type transporter Mla MlaB component
MMMTNTSEDEYTLTLTGDVNFDEMMPLLSETQNLLNSPLNTKVDWSQVEWIHFACLQVFISLKKSLNTVGKSLTFSQPSPKFAQALHENGVDQLLGDYEDFSLIKNTAEMPSALPNAA